jgi:hypothetical protein
MEIHNMNELVEFEKQSQATRTPVRFTLHAHRGYLRCDECFAPADAVHFLDAKTNGYPIHEIRVSFTCASHDHGGYWMHLDEILAPDGDSASHVAQKMWGLRALDALRERLEEIDRQAFRDWKVQR